MRKSENAPFLAGGGATSEQIASHDWSTSLGPISTWPSSLKTTVGILLHSPVPIVLLWGEDGIMIYNDAYSVFAGGRHPELLGSKVREGWSEVADFNDNVMKVGMAGGTLSYRDQELTLYRTGAPEQVFMNLDYSPVFGESGRPAGVIAVVVETSERVAAKRKVLQNEARLLVLDALGKEAARSNDADAILAITTRMTGEYLKVAICAYADMDVDQDGFTIRGDWSAPGSPSIVGHYSLTDFGKLAVRNLSAGRPLVINDNLRELALEEAATFQNIGIAATICMPLVKQGRLIALMAIHDKVPRKWNDGELALITEVTERSWAHIERVSAEAALRASEQQLRVLAQVMPNHVWTSRPDGLLDWFNEQVYMYSGEREGDLDGREWTKIVHPDDLANAVRQWEAALSSGEDYEVEFRLRRYDGQYRWHLTRAVALRDRDDTIVRWIGTNTDVLSAGWKNEPPSGIAFGVSAKICWASLTVMASGSV
jgi:PAS domain S-box-containing protein